MNLVEFMASAERSYHIEEPGIEYYVRKSVFFPGVIELATVHNYGVDGIGFYRFLKRYAGTVPFYMEQVINPAVAAYMRRLGWIEREVGDIPQFASPLMVQRYGMTDRFEMWFGTKALLNLRW